jgi:hypothetical protein
MKHIQLKDVMSSLRIVTYENGYVIYNAAGKAKYDVVGLRVEVYGIPEYFPERISLEGGQASGVNGEYRINDCNGSPALVVGKIDKQGMKAGPVNIELNIDTTDAQKKLDEIEVAFKDSKAFEFLSGKAYINEALITPGEVENAQVGEAVLMGQPVTNNITFNGPMNIGAEHNIESIIKNAISSDKLRDEVNEIIRKAISNELRPGGSIFSAMKG